MAKVVQYPHYLFVESPGGSYQDANGDWMESDTELVFIGKCREEADGRGTEVKTADGTYHHATSLIQCPKGTRKIDIGETCVVANDDEGQDVRIKGKCLRCDPSQLHCRIWV